jgi:hypothetical protein
MASSDIDPCRGTQKLENEKFATSSLGKTVVRVADDEALAVLEQILALQGGSAGAPFHEDAQTQTTPGVEQTLISFTVGAGLSRNLNRARVVCRHRVKYNIEVNGQVVGSGRTGAGNLTDDFIWLPGFPVAQSILVELKATQSGGPATDIEAYLMGNET